MAIRKLIQLYIRPNGDILAVSTEDWFAFFEKYPDAIKLPVGPELIPLWEKSETSVDWRAVYPSEPK